MAAGDFLDCPSTGNGAFRNIAVGVACALLLHTTDKSLFSLMIKIFIYLFIYLFSWQLAVCSHFFSIRIFSTPKNIFRDNQFNLIC